MCVCVCVEIWWRVCPSFTAVISSRSFRYVLSVLSSSLAMKYALSAGQICTNTHNISTTSHFMKNDLNYTTVESWPCFTVHINTHTVLYNDTFQWHIKIHFIDCRVSDMNMRWYTNLTFLLLSSSSSVRMAPLSFSMGEMRGDGVAPLQSSAWPLTNVTEAHVTSERDRQMKIVRTDLRQIHSILIVSVCDGCLFSMQICINNKKYHDITMFFLGYEPWEWSTMWIPWWFYKIMIFIKIVVSWYCHRTLGKGYKHWQFSLNG